MTKTKRYLGLGGFLAGVCFLFDPFISVFDILPDFIGYCLIAGGLSMLSSLDGRIAESLRGFRTLAILSGVRYLSIPFIFGLTSASEQPMELLLFSFCLAVLDLIVLIPAWRNLSAGFITLASRHDGTVPLEVPGKHPRASAVRSRTERMMTCTVVFFIVKEVLAVLPEMTVLANELSGAVGAGMLASFYDFIGIIRFLCGGVALIFGVFWLIRLFTFSSKVRKDTAFFENLRHAWNELLTAHPDMLSKKVIKAALVLIGIGFAFTADFFSDGYNVLPDALAVILWLVALFMLKKYARGTAPVIAGLFVYLPVSLAANVWQSVILHELAEMGGEDFTLVDNAARMLHNTEDASRYFMMCALLTAAQLLLVALLVGVGRVIVNVIDRYTGLSVSGREQERIDETHRLLSRKLLTAVISGAVASVFSCVYAWTLPYAVGNIMEIFGMLDIVLHILFCVFYFRAVGSIFEEIEYRYLLS